MSVNFRMSEILPQIHRILVSRGYTAAVQLVQVPMSDTIVLLDATGFQIARVNYMHFRWNNYYRDVIGTIVDQLDRYILSRDIFEGKLNVCL